MSKPGPDEGNLQALRYLECRDLCSRPMIERGARVKAITPLHMKHVKRQPQVAPIFGYDGSVVGVVPLERE